MIDSGFAPWTPGIRLSLELDDLRSLPNGLANRFGKPDTQNVIPLDTPDSLEPDIERIHFLSIGVFRTLLTGFDFVAG